MQSEKKSVPKHTTDTPSKNMKPHETPLKAQKPTMPELSCAVHKSKVILVCTKPDCKNRIFLCAKCVTLELKHLNEHSPLMLYDEFAEYIINLGFPKREIQPEEKKFIEEKPKNVSLFTDHIAVQQEQLSNSINTLQDIYKDKCEELKVSLKGKLYYQEKMFCENYEKFENEANVDKEKDAGLPKFEEIKQSITEKKDLEEIESYLRDVIKRKQAWQNTTTEIKELSSKTQDYYKNTIVSQLGNLPKITNMSSVIANWTSGFTKIINDIKGEFNIENIVEKIPGIPVSLSSIDELKLLTSKMIKKEIHMTLNFESKTISPEEAEEIKLVLSKLDQLQWLSLKLENSSIQIDNLVAILNTIRSSMKLEFFSLKLDRCDIKDDDLLKISAELKQMTSLVEADLGLGLNSISDASLGVFAQALSGMTKLNSLKLDLKSNSINSKAAAEFSDELGKLVNLTILGLNFGGSNSKVNSIEDEGLSALAKALINLKFLKELELDVGQNNLSDKSIIDLAMSLKELKNIKIANIQIYSNNITARELPKLLKLSLNYPLLL